MWRWLKVPRSVSWPVRRSGVPSVSSDANASASACAQSIPCSPPAAVSASRRRSSCLTSFGWTVKPSGTRSSCSPSSRSRAAGTAVSTSGLGERSSWYSPVGCSSPCSATSAILDFRRWCSRREVVPHLLGLLLDLLLRDDALGDQAVGPHLGHALLVLDLRVHLRLRVGGLVGLVVPEAPVADQVDQHVVAELLAERECEPHGADARRHVVGVDVDDRHVEALGEVGGPARRAGVVGVGREADLVVHDQVDGAADLVAVQRLQVERLGDDALGGERGVAVDHDRNGGVRVLVGVRAVARGLRRARRALDDGRDVLQVARVGLEVHADRAAVGQLVGALGAVVVLDVARPALRDRGHDLERARRPRTRRRSCRRRGRGCVRARSACRGAPSRRRPPARRARRRAGSARRASAPSCRGPRSRTGAGRGRPCA